MSRSIRMELPSLAKEGWLRPLRKSGEASLAGADGVVRSTHRLLEVERTTPSAPVKERDHLLDGASTPPLPRRGVLTHLWPASAGRGRTRNSRCKFRELRFSPRSRPNLNSVQCLDRIPTVAPGSKSPFQWPH